jgi:hypothetical protein
MKQILLLSDMFGYEPKMLIDKSENLKSSFGGVLSVLIIILIIWSIWIFGNDIIYKTKPDLITSTYKDPSPLRTEFNDDNYILTLGLQQPDYTFFYDETIYRFKVENLMIERFPNNTQSFSSREIETVRCSEKKLNLLYNEYFSNLDLNNLACLKNGSFVLQGFFGTQTWRWIFISLEKCKNSTSNNFNCKPLEVIDKYLAGGYLGMFVSDQTVLPTNYSNPIMSFGLNIYTTFASDVYREVWLYYKKLQIISDIGWLMEDKETVESFSYDVFKEVWDKRDTSEVIMKVGIGMGLSRVVYERSYLKLQEIAANVRGIIKFLFLCGKLVSFYHNNLKFQSWMVHYFYEMKSFDFKNDVKFSNQTRINNFVKKEENKLETYLVEDQKKVTTQNMLKLSIDENVKDKDITSKALFPSRLANLQIENLNFAKNINSNDKDQPILSQEEKSLEMSTREILTICCFSSVKKKKKIVDMAYARIESRLQWLNFIKHQNDLEIVKEIVLDKHQNDILDLTLLKKDHYSLYVINYFT